MTKMGMGFILGHTYRDPGQFNLYKNALGKTIASVHLDEEESELRFKFTDGTGLKLFDDGQSCCESRYMTTDDDLTYYAGAKFMGVEIKEAPDIEDEEGDVHEVQFLEVKTDKGVFTMATHNEHNGYYGGFDITIKEDEV
jgi:hypothetical protein